MRLYNKGIAMLMRINEWSRLRKIGSVALESSVSEIIPCFGGVI